MNEGEKERERGIKMIKVPEGAIICDDLSFEAIKRVAGEDGEQLPSTMEANKEGARWYGTTLRREWVPTVPGKEKPRGFFDENRNIIRSSEPSVNPGQEERVNPEQEEEHLPKGEAEWIREQMRTRGMSGVGAEGARRRLRDYFEEKRKRER